LRRALLATILDEMGPARRTSTTHFGSCIAVALALAGCATAAPMRDGDEPLIEEGGVTRAAAPTPAPAPAAPPPAPFPASPPGTIPRAALREILGTSPGTFLSRVDVDAAFVGTTFYGWRVRRLFPGDARLAAIDVIPGDVVIRINGAAVERPDQFLAVWRTAPTRRDLVIELRRAGKPRTLRWTLVD